MISAAQFCRTLQAEGFSFFTGVPCSTFTEVLNHLLAEPDVRYLAAANEGAALAIAAGAHLAGRRTVVMTQSSGVGNLVNPLATLSLIYRIPTLILVSARGYPDGEGDEPQHRLTGSSLRRLFAALGVEQVDVPSDAAEFAVLTARAMRVVEQGGVIALVIPKGTVGTTPGPHDGESPYPLTRLEAVRTIVDCLNGGEIVISTTAMISRELLSTGDRSGHFYMQGSMGHAMAIGLGVAFSRPSARVVVLDGDGAAIMHMGSMSTIGHYGPANLVHILLDNEAYESTGGQPTTASTTSLELVAEACGYAQTYRCISERELIATVRYVLDARGPSCVVVKVNCSRKVAAPRVSGERGPAEITHRVREFLGG